MTDVALFGAGRIGKIHAGNLVRQPGVTLKYVVDVNAAAAGELAQKYGAKVGSADQAFGDAAVKAAVIASSTDTHAELIRRAAAAKKAIFCEKPVDLSLSRARECQQAVADAGVTCLIGFQRRYDPTFAALKERLAAGEIGERAYSRTVPRMRSICRAARRRRSPRIGTRRSAWRARRERRSGRRA